MSRSAPHSTPSTPAHAKPAARQQAGGHPAVMSLQREVGIALDAGASPDVRAAALSKLHAAMATHKISRPSVAVALLPWFLSSWPHLVACLWDPNPQLPAAVAPLLGLVGGLVASSRAAATAAESDAPSAAAGTVPTVSNTSSTSTAAAAAGTPAAAAAAGFGGPPVPPAGLLFDWMLPLLTGTVPLPNGTPAPLQLQVLICKSLIYALQQLPTCTNTCASHGMSAAGTAATSVAETESKGAAPQPAGDTTAMRQKQPPALLQTPVPPVAAQQLHQHASAILDAAMKLLESPATPPALLAPLLQVLLEVLRLDVTAVTGEVLRDLLDLLLGWSLEPGLQVNDRQLLTGVLASCKPCWLAEPQLLQDVSSKLLADLQQQLTASTATSQEEATASVGYGQQEQEQQKFLALLSCLVAILHAAVSEPGCQHLVEESASLLLSAHARYIQRSAERGDSSVGTAAAAVANLMLTFLQSLLAAASADIVSAAAAEGTQGGHSCGSEDTAGKHDSSTADADQAVKRVQALDADVMFRMWRTATATLMLPQLTAELAITVLKGLNNTLTLVAAAATAAAAPAQQQAAAAQPHLATANALQQQQHADVPVGHSARLSRLASHMCHHVFASTINARISDLPGTAAAAAALYTTALAANSTASQGTNNSVLTSVLAELVAVCSHLEDKHSSRDSQHLQNSTEHQLQRPQQRQKKQQEAEHCSEQTNVVIDDTPGSCAVHQASVDLSEQQLVDMLQFDLVLLEGWIHGCLQQHQHESPSAVPPASAATPIATTVADCVVAAATEVVEAVHKCMQMLLSADGWLYLTTTSSIELLSQTTAVVQALVGVHQLVAFDFGNRTTTSIISEHASVAQHATATGQAAPNIQEQLLGCLQLLLDAHEVPPDVYCTAIVALRRLVLGPAGWQRQQEDQLQQLHDDPLRQRGNQHAQQLADTTADREESATEVKGRRPILALSTDCACWHEVVRLLSAAANKSKEAIVRAAATAATAELASILWLQGSSSSAGLLVFLLPLLAVLVQRSSDVDAETAAVAQSAVAGLAVPLYLIQGAGAPITSVNHSGTAHKQLDDDTCLSHVSWVRVAALQPQQRMFKPLQLAQLFELLFQASPLLLQRRQAASTVPPAPAATPAGVVQVTQQRYQTQAGALYRLAQGLPPLPTAVQSSSKLSSSRGGGSQATFDALVSSSDVKWLLIQEAARHFVIARLRTHLGNPIQTFAALERILHTMLKQLHTDRSPAAARRAWQQQLTQQLQALLPQQQQQAAGGHQQEGPREPQLLQAPVGGLLSRSAAQHQQQEAVEGRSAANAAAPEAQVAVEQQRLESEAATVALLDFMWALEVNIQAAAEGSLLRPDAGKPTMTFFAGNKKACDEWFARTRESLLGLSAAVGGMHLTIYHGLARLHELHSAFKGLTAQYHAQQQHLHNQQREAATQQEQQHTVRQQDSSSRQAAAAAAAAAVTGLGDKKSRLGKQQPSKQLKQHSKQSDVTDHVKLQAKQVSSMGASTNGGFSGTHESPAAAAAAFQNKLKALQQQYQAAVIGLSAPVLSTLALLTDGLLAAGEGSAILGLYTWVQDKILPVWQGISRMYGLDVSIDTAAEFDSMEDQPPGPSSSSTELLLAWLPAAADEAEGRYEAALQLYDSFLQSPVSSVAVAVCLKGFVLEHMAACYAAIGDWQGLCKLSRMHSSAATPGGPTGQQQQQHAFSTRHWMLAGSAVLEALQHWELFDVASSHQQHRGQQQQHGLSRGTGGSHVGSKDIEQQMYGSMDQSDLLHGHLTSLSSSERAILRAMVACSSDSNNSSASAGRAVDSRQRQRGRGRGRGRPSGIPQQHELQEQYPLRRSPNSLVLTDLQAALQLVSSNPLFLTHAANGVICPADRQQIGQTSDRLQELALMQLLQEALSVQQEHHGTASSISGLQPNQILQTAIMGWSFSRSSESTDDSSSGSSLWAAALAPDGGLRRGCFQQLRMVLPLIQVLTSHPTKQQQPATCVLLREGLLCCHASNCGNTLQHLLHIAEAHTSTASNQQHGEEQQHWLQLLKTKLLLSNSSENTSSGSVAVKDAVSAHLKVLQPFWPIVSDANSVSSVSSASAVSAAYLSLAALLSDQASDQTGDWEQLLQTAAACYTTHSLADTTRHLAAAGSAVTPEQLPPVACCTAAVAATPANPASWRAFGDLLYKLAGTAGAASSAADTEQLRQNQQHQLYLAACEAYSNYLATAVNAQALASPEQGLGILLRLLQVTIEHGDSYEDQLQQVLHHIPVSAWQALTPQLLGQLQHGSAAVRNIVQRILQGLSVVVPCAVLYPLVVEVRAAEEAGQQPPTELSAVLSQLQSRHPRLLADTCAMAAALSQLTVTPREHWAGVLGEIGVEVNRKLLALQADASRQNKQGLTVHRQRELLTNRYQTMMSPVLAALQQHLTAATAAEPRSPDESAFREDMLPKVQSLLEQLKTPPAELMPVLDDIPATSSTAGQQTVAAAGCTSSSKATASTATGAKVGGISSGGWGPLKQLQQQLAQQLGQQHRLDLATVAPLLASLRDTAIPLPADDLTKAAMPPLPLGAALGKGRQTVEHAGASDAQDPQQQDPLAGAMVTGQGDSNGLGNWLCIAGVEKTVLVLPTKTRPKRLRLVATDGSVHAYLLKGRDDLRVDERIMQVMRTANALLAAADHQDVTGANSRRSTGLKIRTYSITPFGRRAGLVQWVRHTTSLFYLVRQWQQATAERYHAVAAAKREAAAAAAAAAGKEPTGAPESSRAQAAASAAKPDTAAAPAKDSVKEDTSSKGSVILPLIVAATRPVDAFYARLLPALQAAGVPVGAPRSSWPVDALRSAFNSLQREAPRHLLAHQLMSGAAHPGSWWASQQAFTTSAAVGSMLGWLLGLGDRHLDNLLLDTDTGELLHIDFSVCFDKGAALAVPEVVPFRLTQMLQIALGPGGVAGGFSAVAASVLTVLQQSSELLSALLALLLSDPAVDWSVEREAHAAKKDQDTAVSLNLFASRIEELRPQMLLGLAPALPTIGNGLAAVVSYGEAHVYMHQLQSRAAAAQAKAAAAQAALAEATAGEATALSQGATASQRLTASTADYRRLCGLAATCISSAANWLSRHEQTLRTLALAPVTGMSASVSLVPGSVADVRCLDAPTGEWDATESDRPLLLLESVMDSGSTSRGGILSQSLHPLLARSLGSSIDLALLLPASLYQQCRSVDAQGQQLLQQLTRIVAIGKWAVASYSLVLQQLLPGTYIKQSHHWCWSHAFTAAVSGATRHNLTAVIAATPAMPASTDVAKTWASLAACWVACQLKQQRHEDALVAASDASKLSSGASAISLRAQLAQLAGQLNAGSESDAANAQLMSSRALLAVCDQATAAVQQLQDVIKTSVVPEQHQLSSSCSQVQEGLVSLQAVLLQFQEAGLSYITDLSASTMTDELPEAAATLEDLIDQADGDEQQIRAALQQQQTGELHQWVAEAAGQLQLVMQLLSAIDHEALAPLSAWEAAVGAGGGPGAVGLSGNTALAAVALHAGPVSQLQLWTAASQLVSSCWQQLQHQLQHAQQLEAQMQALAAVAAAGGAASIDPTDSALAAQVDVLQRHLLPQGYSVAYLDDCVTAAHLLQIQWTEAERSFTAVIASCLCPLLGLTGLGPEHWLAPMQQDSQQGGLQPPAVDEQPQAVLQQLLAAAAASVASGAIMHSKDVFDALAGSIAAAGITGMAGLAGSSSQGEGGSVQWGTPSLSDPWKSLVMLLVQCGCAQQRMQHRQQQDTQATGSADTAVHAPATTDADVLASSKARPLDLDAYRPLVFVVQVLHQLFLIPAAPAADSTSSLATRVQQLLLPVLVRPTMPGVQHSLMQLQQHLQAMCSEAEAVLLRKQGLHRHQQPHASIGSNALQHSSDPGTTAAAAGLHGGLEGLVPFDDFDPSVPGADIVLEEILGGGSEEDEQTTGLAGDITADSGDELLDWLDEEVLLQGTAPAASNSSSDSMQAAPDAAGGGSETAAKVAADLPELVPFDAFDPSLPGAGTALEDEEALGGLGGSLEDEGALGGLGDSVEDEGGPGGLGDSVEDEGGLGGLGDSLEQQLTSGWAEPTDNASAAAVEPKMASIGVGNELQEQRQSADDEFTDLGELCLTAGMQAAEQLLQQQAAAGLQQCAASCAWQQQVWLRHLAAYECMWGDLLELHQQKQGKEAAQGLLEQLIQKALGPAGVSQTPVSLDGSTVKAVLATAGSTELHPGAAYQLYLQQTGLLQQSPLHPDAAHSSSSTDTNLAAPTRQQLLQSWQTLSESAAGVEEGLSAWQTATAATVVAVKEAVMAAAAAAGQHLIGDPTICLKVLSGLCTRSQSWCGDAVRVLTGLSQLGEAALQLEYSRRGTLWAPGVPAGVDAFQGNTSLLVQLQDTISAAIDAEAAVSEAGVMLTSSQAAAVQAETMIDEAAAEQAAAEHEMVLRTPAALARAHALNPMLQPMVEAAESALGLVTEGLGGMFKALASLVEKNPAARDLSPLVAETFAQYNRCVAVLTRLRDIGAAAAGGLQEALQHQQQEVVGDAQQDALLLQLLLTHMQPAVQGVQLELHELGQAHILFTQLTHQLDSLAAAAQTVSAAITAEHATQLLAGDSKQPSGSMRRQRAEARKRAFATAAMQRCTARLAGEGHNNTPAKKDATSSTAAAGQVASLIEAATSIDNLCRMYEGWMPWL